MIPFPDKKYSVIYADPPWNHAAGGATHNAERHYKTMKPEDIFDLPVQDIAEDDCLLFMWATFPNLDVALEAIKRWFYIQDRRVRLGKEEQEVPFLVLGPGELDACERRSLSSGHKGQAETRFRVRPQCNRRPDRRHSEKPAETRDRIVRLAGGVHESSYSPDRRPLGGTPGATKWKAVS